MNEPMDKQQIEALEARIAAVKATQGPKPRGDEHYSGANMAWRMVTELVAGLGIGFGIGYGLDVVLGTLPWLMVLFTLFGLAAGVQTMLRTAREMEQKEADARVSGGETRGQDGD